MDFGARLKSQRERAGLTQAELADGISAASYISLLEAGKRKPKPDLVKKLASRLGISADELVIDQKDQEVGWALNVAQVALSSGDLEVAKDFAQRTLAASQDDNGALLAASVVLLQVRVREGEVEGVLDELEGLFNNHTQASPDVRARIGNEIVRVCFRFGNLGLGIQRGEEMLRQYATLWPETELVELLCLLGSCHYHRGDTNRASELVTRALDLAEKCKSPKAIVQSQWQASMIAESRGDLTLALSHITNAMHWSKLAELNDVLPKLNINAAKIMLELPNPDLVRIHDLAEVAYLNSTAENNPLFAAFACHTLSEVELLKGNPLQALLYVQKGLTELPNEISGPKISLLALKAKALFAQGQIEEAKVQLEITAQYMADSEPSKDLAFYWGEVARAFVEVGLKDRAIYAYERAISVAAASQAEHRVLVESEV
ncbi:MAG TPA: helix-turn-helix transcriptional regulator [Candidatus Nanopelagicaceae bacterium]